MTHTYCRCHEILLMWRPDEKQIAGYIDDGFVPIEMAEGTRSYVDHRELDHHNDLSDHPSACVTALGLYGDLAHDRPARIMVNHTDADSVMTGLTLLGLLPRDFLMEMNREIGVLDTEPLIADIDSMRYADVIDLWKSGMRSVKQSGWSWIAGLNLWLDIYEHLDAHAPALGAMKNSEKHRRDVAIKDMDDAIIGASGRVVLIPVSHVKGFDVQLGRNTDAAADAPEGWRRWCAISRVSASGGVTLSCPCKRIAEYAFGTGGLKNVFPKLPPIDGRQWGGRESVGGSPRGTQVPASMLDEVLRIVDDALLIRPSR